MINNEEKFFSYLKGKMNSEERKIFEDELMHSDNLNQEFDEYKKLNSIIDETKNVSLNKNYSESIIIEFRKRKDSKRLKKKSPAIKYAFISIILITVGYFLISQINKENPQDVNLLLTQYSDSELDSYINDYDHSDAVEMNIGNEAVHIIDSIYSKKISASFMESIENESMTNITGFNSVADVDEYLSDNEVDLIYAQLINKEIL
jgi:hypothetical protein